MTENQWIVFKAKELKNDPDFLLKKLYEKKFNQIIDNLSEEIIINRKEKND
jgi:hypothetical protein